MPSKGKRKAEDNTPASTTTRLTKRQKAMKDNIEKEKAKKEEAKREEAKKAEAKKIDVKKAEASSSKVPRMSVPKKNVTKEKATSNNLEGKKAEASSSKATRKSKAKKKAAPSVGGETTELESELEDQTPAKEDSGDDGHSESTAVAESADDEAKDKAPTLSTENEEDLSLVQLLPPLTAIAPTPNQGKGIASSEVQSEVATPKSEFPAESDVSDEDDEEDELAFEEAVELKAPTWETLEATQGTSAQPTTVPETPSGYLKTDRRAKLFGAIGGVGKFTYTQRTPRDKTLRCTPRSARKSKPDSLLNGSPSRRA